jgi:hypothetical protein
MARMERINRLIRLIITPIALILLLSLSLISIAGAAGPDNGEPVAAQSGFAAPAETFIEELAPDSGATAAASTQKFMFVSASGFTPLDDDMTYNYFTAGCMYRTGGSSFSEYAVQLPQGAIVDYLRVYYYDNDATYNATAFLFSFDGAGNYTEIASAASTGTPGQSSTGSGFVAHTVDNVDGSLELRLSYGGATTSNLRICGVRIRYQYSPLWAAYVPVVQR